jgi:hypothetical protein
VNRRLLEELLEDQRVRRAAPPQAADKVPSAQLHAVPRASAPPQSNAS